MTPTIEEVPIGSIKPYAGNQKTHPDEQVAAVASSIQHFGFVQPLVVDAAGEIIVGHCRFLAALKLALPTVPVIRVSNLTPAEVAALRIADNKLNESPWDMESLSESMRMLDPDLARLTGFNGDELVRLCGMRDVASQTLPDLASGAKSPFQQKTFTLHDSQALVVDQAIALAKSENLGKSQSNENTNGNALYNVCLAFITARGQTPHQ